MKLLVHASGFRSPFQNDVQELRCGKPREVGGNPNCHWSPSSVDLAALGRASGGSQPAATIDELLNLIQKQAVNSIDELRIIGHSNETYFALGGSIIADNVTFAEPAMLGDSATFLNSETRIRGLHDRFKTGAQITLMGCGSGGTGGTLLDLLSRIFMVKVNGFKRPIQYAIDGTTAGRIVQVPGFGQTRFIANDARITVRGKVMYSYAGLAIEETLGQEYVTRSALGTDAWAMKPDAESNVGPSILNAAGRSGRSAIDARLAAFEVGWRIIKEFHPTKAHLVAGVGYEPNLAGLRVVIDGNAATINVGDAYVRKTDFNSLPQRAAEMGDALHNVSIKKAGMIPMR